MPMTATAPLDADLPLLERNGGLDVHLCASSGLVHESIVYPCPRRVIAAEADVCRALVASPAAQIRTVNVHGLRGQMEYQGNLVYTSDKANDLMAQRG